MSLDRRLQSAIHTNTATFLIAMDIELEVVQLGDGGNDAEAQAVSRHIATSLASIEPLPNGLPLFDRNAGTAVRHFDTGQIGSDSRGAKHNFSS